jgi:hypothetical protein
VELTEEEIEAELQRLDQQRAEIHAEMLRLNDDLARRRARATLARMGDGERAALLQVVQAEGVASAEAVGPVADTALLVEAGAAPVADLQGGGA